VRRADNLRTFTCQLSWNLGTSNSWNPQGLSRLVTGSLYLLRKEGVAFRGKVVGRSMGTLFFKNIFQDIVTLVSVALITGSFTTVLVWRRKLFSYFQRLVVFLETVLQMCIPYLVESRGTVKSTTLARAVLIPNASTAMWTCFSTIILIIPFVVPFFSTEPLTPSAG